MVHLSTRDSWQQRYYVTLAAPGNELRPGNEGSLTEPTSSPCRPALSVAAARRENLGVWLSGQNLVTA